MINIEISQNRYIKAHFNTSSIGWAQRIVDYASQGFRYQGIPGFMCLHDSWAISLSCYWEIEIISCLINQSSGQ